MTSTEISPIVSTEIVDYMTHEEFEDFSRDYVNNRATRIANSIRNGKNVVCIGSGGTSKTFTVRHVINTLIETELIQSDQYVVVSYVGVAALNANGRTINSTFMFPINIDPEKYIEQAAQWAASVKKGKRYKVLRELLERLKIIINDEFSVTSGKFMMFMSHAFQAYYGNEIPFGGLQIICMGDPLQLLPIERVNGRPSLSTYILDDHIYFDIVHFNFGFRYTVKEDDRIVLKKDWFNFLNDLRYGKLPASHQTLYDLGIRVITSLEYIRFEEHFGRLVMAQLNATVDKWNNGINKIYEQRNIPIHNLGSVYYDISAVKKPDYVCLTEFGDADFIKGIYKICLSSSFIKHKGKRALFEILDELQDTSIKKLKELVENVYIKEVNTKQVKDQTYNMSSDGIVPITLPTEQEIRDKGLIMIRINKASGYPDLVNGTIMVFDQILNDRCIARLPGQEDPYEIKRVQRYHYDLQGNKLTICCQWPFIQADACTVTKSQGLTLNKAGYLLDERVPYYDMYHSQYVALSRVRNPCDFMYIHSVDASLGSVDDIMNTKIQLKRLKLAFTKIKQLVKVYDPILEKMIALEKDS